MAIVRMFVLTLAVLALSASSLLGQAKAAEHWIATWATAVVARAPMLPPAPPVRVGIGFGVGDPSSDS